MTHNLQADVASSDHAKLREWCNITHAEIKDIENQLHASQYDFAVTNVIIAALTYKAHQYRIDPY